MNKMLFSIAFLLCPLIIFVEVGRRNTKVSQDCSFDKHRVMSKSNPKFNEA